MKNKRIIKIIILFISIILTISLIYVMVHNSKFLDTAKHEENIEKETECLDIAEIENTVDQDKIFYIQGEGMFIYLPTIENLYKNSDVVMIGTFDKNLKTYVPGISIHTKMQFNTIDIIKNTSNININDNVTFDILGGAVTLSEYIKDNHTIKDGEFEEISIKERDNYYVVQDYAPENKLDLNSNSKDKYVLFLSLRDGELVANSSYYGIRKLNDNKLYDYDTNKYIDSDLIEKN